MNPPPAAEKVDRTLKKESSPETDVASKPPKGKVRENVEALVIAIILALFIRAFVVQAFKIPSGSMQNTLLIGDYILVNKFIYGVKIPFTEITVIPVKEPKKGDIIVFKYPDDPSKDFIKRVVAVGGDTVEIREKKVSVNGKPEINKHAIHSDPRVFDDPHLYTLEMLKRDNKAPLKVPEGKLFVMGDNRDESNDSRFWGLVNVSAVRGKAFIIYWSWNSHKKIGLRWDRLGDLIE
ncbi:MAG: signal peptidase I [Desulfobacteraceae bacterium]